MEEQTAISPQYNENFVPLLHEVLSEIRKLRLGDDDLWTAQEIADYMKYKRKTIQGFIINKPDFPTPYIIPSSPDGSGGGKRWKSGEVKQWALKHKARY